MNGPAGRLRIAVVDSGISGEVAGGIDLCGGNDLRDHLGHGTIVATSILTQAPWIEIFAVKIFDRDLQAPATRLTEAFVWCAEQHMDLVNLSVGAVGEFESVPAPGMTVVAPAGSCPAVGSALIAVEGSALHRGAPLQLRPGVFRASVYPPPMPGRTAARDAFGVSFAVANVTAHLALLRGQGRPPTPQSWSR